MRKQSPLDNIPVPSVGNNLDILIQQITLDNF